MGIQHRSASSSVEEIVTCVREYGHVVIDELASAETLDRIDAELAPYYESTPFGTHAGYGLKTQRTGGLVARSKASHELILNPLYNGAIMALLSHASMVQLSLTEVIALAPGAEAQFLHQDELLWDEYPFDPGYEMMINSLWAMTDITEEMGATRVVPGSHTAGRGQTFTQDRTVPVEMTRGSVLVFSGKLYHGGGENRSTRTRRVLDLGFAVGWVRQEENQYLVALPEVARTFPPELQRLVGYNHAHGYGHMADRLDPVGLLG